MKKNAKIYLLILIIFFVVTLAVASYAYITRGQGVGDLLNANTATTEIKPVFTAYSEGDIEFNVSALQMSQINVTTEPVETDNATIYVDLTSSTDYEGTRCTYDIVWVWDSDDKYTTPDVKLPYTAANGTVYPYEFSVTINDGEEKDLSSYEWNEIGEATLVSQQLITSVSATDATKQSFKFEVKMYNIEAAQRNLFRKDFKGHIEVRNQECYTSGITSTKIAGVDYSELYDGNPHTISFDENRNDENVKDIKYYYSTATELTQDNYKTAGSTTSPTRTEQGVTTVYWCAEDDLGVFLTCGTNKIDINGTLESYIRAKVNTTQSANSSDGQVINENGYRYEGRNPYNYICLGSTASPCPADNLYRIIGTFNEYNTSSGSWTNSYVTKVIKNTNYGNGTYAFNGNSSYTGWNNNSNYYRMAHFEYTGGNNPINTILNSNYYNALNNDLRNQIATTRFMYRYQNVSTWPNSYNMNQIYNYEKGSGCAYGNCFADANVALLSLSDYGYSSLASTCSRTTNNFTNNSSCIQGSWIGKMMYSNISTSRTWLINFNGYNNGNQWINYPLLLVGNSSNGSMVLNYNTYNYSSYYVFPVFHLKNQVHLVKGKGTSSDPYYVSL